MVHAWPRVALAAFLAFGVCIGIIVGMYKWFPGVNPAFVLFPVVIGYVAIIWRLSPTWERQDREEEPPSR